MASNVELNAGSGGAIAATAQISHDGDTAQLQLIGLMGIAGTEDSYTAAKINGDATNGLDVDVTRVVPGTSASHLGKAEDAAHASGDVGVGALAVRQDAEAALAGTDGDYTFMGVDALNRLRVRNVEFLHASGGATPYKNLDVDESEDEIKGSAGKIMWLHVMNLSAEKRYLKFYDDTAANVTVGTTTPVLTLPIPTMADTNGAGFTLAMPGGVQFTTAITVAATTGLADNDTGAPGANEVVVNLGYA